jgi:hypothetical protein
MLLEAMVFLSTLIALNCHLLDNIVTYQQTWVHSYKLLYLYLPKIQEMAAFGEGKRKETFGLTAHT